MVSKRAAYERENVALTSANKSLRDQLKKLKADHRKALAAKNAELKALRDSWELFDTFGHLHRLILLLDKVRAADTTLRSPAGGSPAAWPTSQAERGIHPDPDRSRVARASHRLGELADDIEQWMSPRGPLVDEEIPDVSKPRCFNLACPARFRPQGFDLEICVDCKHPFIDHRDPHTKCWKTECGEKLGRSRGHLGSCP